MLKRYTTPKMNIKKFINIIITTTASNPEVYVPGLRAVDVNNKTKIKLEEMAEITQYNFNSSG